MTEQARKFNKLPIRLFPIGMMVGTINNFSDKVVFASLSATICFLCIVAVTAIGGVLAVWLMRSLNGPYHDFKARGKSVAALSISVVFFLLGMTLGSVNKLFMESMSPGSNIDVPLGMGLLALFVGAAIAIVFLKLTNTIPFQHSHTLGKS